MSRRLIQPSNLSIPAGSRAQGRLSSLTLDELQLIRNCYTLLATKRSGSLSDVAIKLDVPYRRLTELVEEFEKQSGHRLFFKSRGNGGTTAIIGANAQAVLTRLDQVLRAATPLFPTSDFCIRIAAGVTACSCLLPSILKKFREWYQDVHQGSPVTFDLLYGLPSVLQKLRNECDVLLVETDDAKSDQATFNLPLRLIVHRSHRLARRIDAFPAMDAVIEELGAERLVILGDQRDTLPTYPTALLGHDTLRIERLKSYALLHAMVMAGTAVTLSTPLLLSDEQRRELRVLPLPEGSGHLCFQLECPALGGFRTDNQRTAIFELHNQIFHCIKSYTQDRAEHLTCRAAWHISHRSGEPQWVPGAIWWSSPAPHTLTGWYQTDEASYHLVGDITNSDGGRLHCVFKAFYDGNTKEEFVASYICTQESLNGHAPMVGVWLGRRSGSENLAEYTPSLGLSVLLSCNDKTEVTAARLNSLIQPLLRGELRHLPIAHMLLRTTT